LVSLRKTTQDVKPSSFDYVPKLQMTKLYTDIELYKRYELTEDEIQKNEELWREERDQPELQTTQGQDLRSIGITPAGLESDIDTGQAMTGLIPPGEQPAAGPPGAGGAPAIPGPGAPAAPGGGGAGIPTI
jgi:hypothetical protein